MPEIGFPSAHHEDTIALAEVGAADADALHAIVETALRELGWNSAENADEEYTQFFRPNGTWWKTRWKTGRVKILSDRVLVRIEKFALGDVVDWDDGCAKLVGELRAKVLEVAARPAYR